MVDSASHVFMRRPRSIEGAGPSRPGPSAGGAGNVRLLSHEDEVTLVHATSSDVFALAVQACERAPTDLAAWERLELAAHARPHTGHVIALYRSVLARDLPLPTRLALGERAVRFHDEWSDDEEERLEILMAVLALDGGAVWAFERAALQLTSSARWEELLGLYDRAIASRPASQRGLLLREAAHAARELAGRPDRAVAYLVQLFESGELIGARRATARPPSSTWRPSSPWIPSSPATR